LSLSVVAEGVETAEQLAFLEEHGCDYYQGYFFSRPLAAECFPESVENSGIVRGHPSTEGTPMFTIRSAN
ncbi:MAG TPA: EAL domain-containing protein, partial [Accumulibacter sp.]|nr:EAL domain-containing protein [Accumulibacter sp.]